MRPVADTTSALKTPLNEIMGYQGNIRLLRCLSERTTSMSFAELAEQTGISLPGVHKAVARLEANGIIAFHGSGRQQLITLRKEYPLYNAITELFKSESKRFDSLKNTIRQEIKKYERQLRSAWMYGKVAQGKDKYGDPVQIALLGDAAIVDQITEELRKQIRDCGIESKYDATIEITGLSQADLEASKKTIIGGYDVLAGMDPIFFTAEQRKTPAHVIKHADLDNQSLEAGKAWGKLLKKYPEIISRTIDHLENRIPESDSGTGRELQEWKHLLESMSVQRLVKFLSSDSERSVRLRQSNPFWQVITEHEKARLYQLLSKQKTHES